MPVSLKRIKKELQADIPKVGKGADGDYKFTPPNIVGRKVKNYTQLKISKVVKEANEKVGKIKVTCLSASESTSTKYKVYCEFYEAKFSAIETKLFKHPIEVRKDGKKVTIYHKDLKYGTNPVRLRCQCMDFRHRFQKPLKDADGLFGGFIGYTRKTPAWPEGNPLANSTNKLGICKHISSLLRRIEDEGILKNR
jgi:hypothetical protein